MERGRNVCSGYTCAYSVHGRNLREGLPVVLRTSFNIFVRRGANRFAMLRLITNTHVLFRLGDNEANVEDELEGRSVIREESFDLLAWERPFISVLVMASSADTPARNIASRADELATVSFRYRKDEMNAVFCRARCIREIEFLPSRGKFFKTRNEATRSTSVFFFFRFFSSFSFFLSPFDSFSFHCSIKLLRNILFFALFFTLPRITLPCGMQIISRVNWVLI